MSVIVILGASALQRPLIRAARAAGCRVISVDNIPENVGHLDSDRSYDVSTRDVEGVIAIARAERAQAVLTACSDVALPAVAAANATLELGGFGEQVLDSWYPKDRLRRFQREHALIHPAFVEGVPGPELIEAARKLEAPVVVKPSDRSGSRGVVCISENAGPGLGAAIEAAAAEGFVRRVVVEEFIAGVEYGGDAWVREGEIEAAFVTRKDMQDVVVRGHHYPSGLPPEQQTALVAALQDHTSAARYPSGPLNFDVLMTKDGKPYVLEIAPRLGGNWIPQLIEFATGTDLFGAVIREALGESVRLEPQEIAEGASHVLAAIEPAQLEKPVPIAEIRAAVPGLVSLEIDVEVGGLMTPMRDSGQQVGRALFDLGKQDYHEAVEALHSALSPWIPLSTATGSEVASE